MSGVYENLPFARGATYGTTDATIGVHLEGREYVHQDRTYGSNRWVRVRVVRNSATIALAPKRLVTCKAVAGKDEMEVDGYCDVDAERSYVVDEFLPSGGAAVGDLFYVVVEGPTLATTSLDAGANNVITVGEYLCGQTSAASTSTTAGRAMPAVFTAATAILAGQIQNVVGRAMSAKTTGNTAASVLINVTRF